MDIDNKSNQDNLRLNTLPPRLSSQAIKEFQELYLKEYKIQISVQEADRLGMNLLRLISAIYKPIKKNEYANK